MSTINAKARRWAGGWELEIDADNMTQVRNLGHARQQIVDYLDTVDSDTDHSGWDISIVPELGAITVEIREAKEATARAAGLQAEAAKANRKVVKDLRSQHLSLAEVAAVLNISKGRVSQLEREDKTATH